MYKQLIYKALSKAEKIRNVFDKLIFKSVTVLVFGRNDENLYS